MPYGIATDSGEVFRQANGALIDNDPDTYEERCQGALALLRQAQRDAADPLRRAALERRIAALRPLLRECRQLQRLTAHYYDRSYCRDQRYRI